MKPNYGQIVSLDNKHLIDVDEDTQHGFSYTGKTVVMGDGIRCATFINDKGEVFAQPWAISDRFKRPGELNAGARLTNEQVREMVRLHIVDKKPIIDLAEKFDISAEHCQNIVEGRAWRHITANLIEHLSSAGSVGVVKSATNKPKAKNKLSPVMIPFIRKDRVISKMTTAALAKKYCVSQRQIQRILKGEAWK